MRPALAPVPSAAASKLDDATPRVVVAAATGQIVYASAGFRSMMAATWSGEGTATQLGLPHPLTSGMNIIAPPGQAARWRFYFDDMRLGSGAHYLVGSLAETGVLSAPLSPGDLDAMLATLTVDLATVSQGNITDAFFMLSADALFALTSEGTICTMNPTAARLFPLARSGLPFALLFSGENEAAMTQAIKNAARSSIAGLGSVECESHAPRGDGIATIAWTITRRDQTLVVVGRDVTVTKRLEQHVARQARQLEKSEVIAELGYWQWDVTGGTLTWSPQMYRMFGVSADDFSPTLEAVAALLPGRERSRVLNSLQRAVLDKGAYAVDFPILSGDRPRFFHLAGRCELDGQGDVIALFGIMQDTTDRIEAERALREAKNAAERAYAAKSQFLANMSHELRTPLNAIIGFSEMMQGQLLGPLGNARYLDYVGGIRESGEHLLDLINDILDMSKMEAGKYQIDVAELNLSKLVNLALHMVESRAGEAGVIVTAAPLPDRLTLIADRRAVLQVVLNLLSNAIKFTPPQGTVTVGVVERDHDIVLTVADTGIGIPGHLLSRITKPFEQAANQYTRTHKGSGLGLAITKELVELHGGTLAIASEVGAGTTVTVILPKAPLGALTPSP